MRNWREVLIEGSAVASRLLLVNASTRRGLFAHPWVRMRLGQRASIVQRCLRPTAEWSATTWERAWHLLALVPPLDGWSGSVPDIVDGLLRRRPEVWTSDVSASWEQLIRHTEQQGRVHLELCTRALHFCLDHARLEVGPVAAASFFPVHAAALQERVTSSWSIFEFLQWDRGLELRRRLVDAFCQGVWPPECFVVACREPWLLRKMCRRMMRQWNGGEFLQRAYGALLSDRTEEHPVLLEALRQILSSPMYHEVWD